jgi:hypothetical protein
MRDDIGLAQDSLQRQREAEEAFRRAWTDSGWIDGPRLCSPDDWATIAREMGITSFYKQLKGEK